MIKLLRHLFIPGPTNNYRSKILHHSAITLSIIILLVFGFIAPSLKKVPSVLGASANISFNDLLILTNQQRIENNVKPLNLNDDLSNAAEMKAKDMLAKNYWAHISPDGTTPWVFIKNSGYDYVYAGENLARGYYSATDVINAWMASPDHRANVLSNNYQDVGFAVESGRLQGEDTILIVEEFGGQKITPPAITRKVLSQDTPVSKTDVNPSSFKTKSYSFAIDSRVFSNNLTQILLILFISTLTLDLLVVERKKVVRFTGHNLDHIFFLTLILVALIFVGRGITL